MTPILMAFLLAGFHERGVAGKPDGLQGGMKAGTSESKKASRMAGKQEGKSSGKLYVIHESKKA
jgi:hypothetical protein